MRRIRAVATALVATAFLVGEASAVEPYVQIETGMFSRDIVEEDAAITGFAYGGRASSTRAIATAGFKFNEFLTVYALGGAADLEIDEFNGFDSSFNGAYGGGVRFDFPISPYRGGLRLFVEGSMLRTTAEDMVQAGFACTAANGCTSAATVQGGYIPRLAEETIEWNEYAVLLGAGSRHGAFGPYGGVRLSMVDAKDRLHASSGRQFHV